MKFSLTSTLSLSIMCRQDRQCREVVVGLAMLGSWWAVRCVGVTRARLSLGGDWVGAS